MNRRRAVSAKVAMVLFLVVGILIGFSGGWLLQEQAIISLQSQQTLTVDTANKEIKITAVVNDDAFTMPTWHSVVYRWGKNAAMAMFLTTTTPQQVYDALKSLGASAGDNVKVASANGTQVQGSTVKVYVTWDGASKRYSLDELVNGYSTATFKFGGNIDTSTAYMTGCVVCLQSCPVGIVSNSVVGWHLGDAGWTLNGNIVPHNGATVTIYLDLQL